ncbi:NAD kinase [Olivibacter sitiensis]|uniref:NAD kinase n=1 Tax=Olivibacter sitiensis TaxID=376470 RepID=UPI00041A6B9B|nr:NAD kinase [Olivibacter sitiensis]
MKIAIYGREFQDSVLPYVQQLIDMMAKHHIEIWIYADFYAFLLDKINFPDDIQSFNDITSLPKVSFLLSLGGDGTMLSAVSVIGNRGIPVTGINLGRLGFLASINKEGIEHAFQELLIGNYAVEKRVLLAAGIESVQGEPPKIFHALNDMTILKKDISAMITLHVHINGELLNSYWSDGLIIATPTGSTAYSLSCGGPIVVPGSGNFIITPISPHNLTVRPIVVNDESKIRIVIESRSDSILFTADSQTASISTEETVTIQKADYHVNLIRLKQESFFKTLRKKLLWGLDTRNY